MQKLKTILAAFGLLVSVHSYAFKSEDVNVQVKDAFSKQFTGAVHASWEMEGEWYFVTFEMEGKQVQAAYDGEGKLLGTSRKINVSEIPLNLAQSLHKKFEHYVFPAMITEISFNGTTFYSVALTGEKSNLLLRCDPNGVVTVEKRMKK